MSNLHIDDDVEETARPQVRPTSRHVTAPTHHEQRRQQGIVCGQVRGQLTRGQGSGPHRVVRPISGAPPLRQHDTLSRRSTLHVLLQKNK